MLQRPSVLKGFFEKKYNLHYSRSIIRMIKSRKMRWAGYVTRMGKIRMYVGFWWESQKKRDYYEDLDVGG
jgi:hypothetical protein